MGQIVFWVERPGEKFQGLAKPRRSFIWRRTSSQEVTGSGTGWAKSP